MQRRMTSTITVTNMNNSVYVTIDVVPPSLKREGGNKIFSFRKKRRSKTAVVSDNPRRDHTIFAVGCQVPPHEYRLFADGEKPQITDKVRFEIAIRRFAQSQRLPLEGAVAEGD